MGTTDDVKKRLPGLQFRVKKSTKAGKTVAGTQHGYIELRCEFTDVKMFEAAVNKLHGFKIFGELAEEIVDAIGEELDNTHKSLKQVEAEKTELQALNDKLEAENERLRGLLLTIETDLEDDKGESAMNDYD